MDNLNNLENSDLDWLAFCYVADELSDEHRAAFETRMAEDQHTRDAVVRAMELASDIYSVKLPEPNQLPVSKVKEPAGRRNWIWQTAAAVLIGTSLGAWLWTSANDDSSVAESSNEALAVAWVDSLQEESLKDIESEASDEFGFDDDSTQEWMLAAISELDESDLESNN